MAYALDLNREVPSIYSGHLKLGGENPEGRSIEFTNYYLLKDSKPHIPVMGEFHFSRYDHRFWEEELLKIKAGGIDIVATYVFWNHIEEDEGVFDWSGNNNLRQFVTLCGKHGLDILVRIGPFAHGECRNGGLPDWLYGRSFEVRSNDDAYLAYVERLYKAIGQQLEGLLFKDCGPVIGIQLDNEYMHCGAPWEVTFRQGMEWIPAGADGPAHIKRLKALALDAGLDVPLYTCTGWRNSPIIEGEILPMQGGYAFTPWSPDPSYQQEPTREFLFRDWHRHPVLNAEATYNAEQYPYAGCEIGGGIQITYYHRPIVPPEAVEAMALVKLGGGSNLMGYYMYHGGSHPVGKHSFMNEYTVPRISYDFQAPLREFGQVADSFRYLRLLHLFLHDFGDLLAPMQVLLPADAHEIKPQNTQSLRWAVRSRDGVGFIFLNNYQDHVEMQDIPDIQFELDLPGERLMLPQGSTLTLRKNVSAILPFGLSLDGVGLKYATTQLLTRIENESDVAFFFFAPIGMVAEYALETATYTEIEVYKGKRYENEDITYVTVEPGLDSMINLTTANGHSVRIFTLTRYQAEHSTKQVIWGQEWLMISEATVVIADDTCRLYSMGEDEHVHLLMYPNVDKEVAASSNILARDSDGFFTRYAIAVPVHETDFQLDFMRPGKAVLRFPHDILAGVDDIILRIDYVGDIGCAFIDGVLIHDNFCNGTCWEISLKQFKDQLLNNEMLLLISPTTEQTGGQRYVQTAMAFRPEVVEGGLAAIQEISLVPQHRIDIHLL